MEQKKVRRSMLILLLALPIALACIINVRWFSLKILDFFPEVANTPIGTPKGIILGLMLIFFIALVLTGELYLVVEVFPKAWNSVRGLFRRF